MRRKYTLALLLSLLLTGTLSAQNFSEWFKQKKTQKKYLLAQIAALETYRQAIAKGYTIAKGGLSLVTELKSGDFLQQRLYLSSREIVSPRIKNYSAVPAIAVLKDKTDRLLKRMMGIKKLDKSLHAQEMEALLQFKNLTLSEMDKDLETLRLLITDGTLKMTDDERISRIDWLYREVRAKFNQVLRFTRDIQTLIMSREKAVSDTRILQRFAGE